ncbi:CTD small phosphatase-like protein 1 [Varroa jacobsoni]|uniref:FCP1 homology domain-containing protein n=1 Tax=Varroa destructor TaxID=109461 RepID=A0A7M7JBY8_VARDE|nr:CTD small phosphatase-like protein 1 [Varroa destructor]XP_022690556.1 CTD small phosphatase-like protein 1 [Varroa jacobsoni]
MFSTKVDENHLSHRFILTASEKKEYRGKNPIGKKPLLPPAQDTQKNLLVLDLDETLIHGTYAVPPVYDFSFKLQLPVSKKTADVYIQIRPYLDEFLRITSQWFELAVYTASLPMYADKILDRIDPKELIKHRLYRQHCAIFKDFYVKDLEFLGRPLNRILIVDNHPASYMAQRDNGVPIYSYFGQPDDTGLKHLLTFLETVRNEDNVIPKARKYAARWRERLQDFIETTRDVEETSRVIL